MSYPTQPAFIHHGTFDGESRSHECLKWMESYTNAVDAKAWDHEPSSNWLTSDHTLVKSTGENVSGGDASWSSFSKELYAPFAQHLHDPQFCVVWETENGWGMIGIATLYWNLVVSGEGSKVKDRTGKEWDGAGPAGFNFRYVKQNDGEIRLSRTEIVADPTPAVATMLKRGMMKPEDLLR